MQGPACPYGRWGQSVHMHRVSETSPIEGPAANVDCYRNLRSLSSDCNNPESTELLEERGWVVIRGVAPQAELDKIVNSRPLHNMCQPVKTQTSEGRAACAFTSKSFEENFPAMRQNLTTIFAKWERNGVAAAAELGMGLHVAENHDRVSRLINIVSKKTFKEFQNTHV